MFDRLEIDADMEKNENEKAKRDIKEYNLQSLYTNKILPHLNEIRKICKVNNLPYFFSTAVKNEKEKTKYINDGVLTGSNNIGLYNDMFEKFLLVMHGGKVNYKEDLDEEALSYILNQLPEEEQPKAASSAGNEDTIVDFVGDL